MILIEIVINAESKCNKSVHKCCVGFIEGNFEKKDFCYCIHHNSTQSFQKEPGNHMLATYPLKRKVVNNKCASSIVSDVCARSNIRRNEIDVLP